MSVEVKVPSVGESISEGSIAVWHKRDGDYVKQDEPLFDLETEKASTTIPAPANGKLHVLMREGEKVAIGAVVGKIDPQAKSAAPASPAPAAPAAEKSAPAAKPAADGAAPAPPPAPAPAAAKSESPASPAGRRLATEEGVDVAAVTGSGKHGVVLKEDVQQHLEKDRAQRAPSAPAAAPASPARSGEQETRQRMSAIRARIATRLLESQRNTASLTTFNEVDMSAIMDLRQKYKDKFKEKHDVGLGFMSFFVKAAVEALKAYPNVNARLEGDDVIFHHFYNVGVAVSTEKGLMVPVLRDADQLSFGQIEKAIGEVAGKARAGKINVADLQGGTFTITNGGIFGSMMSTPILNPPQCGILGMHAINKRAVVVNDQVVIRPMMYLALTYDHRLIDGREAVLFLVRIKECVENPERLLLEV